MSKRRKQDLPAYDGALQDANLDDRGLARTRKPQPLCLERPDEYVDYDYPLPSPEAAEALCAPCEIREACLANAKHRKPAWGIWGGLIWVNGRQAQLMAPDDPRLTGESQEELVA